MVSSTRDLAIRSYRGYSPTSPSLDANSERITASMYNGQEELDNLVWDKNDEDSDKSQKQMRLKTTCHQVEHFVEQKFGKPATLVSSLIIGGFNILYRIRLEGVSPDVIVRLPCPSQVLLSWPPARTGRWENGEIACLIQQFKQGVEIFKIAKYLGRSISSVRKQIDRHAS